MSALTSLSDVVLWLMLHSQNNWNPLNAWDLAGCLLIVTWDI
jgi:hypothetical protein